MSTYWRDRGHSLTEPGAAKGALTAAGGSTDPAVGLLIRSWNIFHGRTHPPGRRLHVEDAIRLASADRPDVLCLQEVPPWALPRLHEWTGLQAFGDVTMRPSVGPLPIPADVGRRLTDLDPVRLRAGLSGQANAILVSPELRAILQRSLVLNDARFRGRQANRLGLGLLARLRWARERRRCQALRLLRADAPDVLVANLHATSLRSDSRVADAEVLRAASFADALAEGGDVVVLAGDFNVEPGRSEALAELSGPEWGFSAPAPGIDQILVRGTPSSPLQAWPVERRSMDGRVLSDHTPVELMIG
jgi:endonuclease/exonuclease/phosphatase family metal-dependent hydrolase